MAETPLVFRPQMALLPVGAVFLATLARILMVQGLPQPEAERVVRDIVGAELILKAPRGTILDRSGLVLAEDRPVWSLVMDAPARTRRFLMELEAGGGVAAQLRARAALEELAASVGRDGRDWERFVLDASVTRRVLARDLTELEAARARAALEACAGNGLRLERGWRRSYPQGRALAHAIGLPGIAESGRASSGLESACETRLAGADGRSRALRMAGSSGVNPMLGFDPVGATPAVQTTLDAALAAFARAELAAARDKHKAASACAVALDVRTGDVLLLESVPDYDPNAPGVNMEMRKTARGQEALGWMLTALWPLEPGSTVKPFVVAEALQRGVISPSERFENYGGTWHIPNSKRVIHNVTEVPTHAMTAAEVLQHSSNIGAVQIGMRIGSEGLRQLWGKLAIHDGPGLSAFDHDRGLFPSAADWAHPNADRWCAASTSFGHAFSLTPLRLGLAWAALVNGGTLLEPRWFLADPVRPVRRVFEADAAQTVTQWVEAVVAGRKDKLLPHWEDLRWGGKSGTAKKTHKDGYTTFFVAFGPVQRPEVVVIVALDEPTAGKARGSLQCGPAAGQILRRALELRGTVAPRLDSDSPRAMVLAR